MRHFMTRTKTQTHTVWLLLHRCPHSMCIIEENLTFSTVLLVEQEQVGGCCSWCSCAAPGAQLLLTLLPLTSPPPVPSRPLQCSMQLEQMSMGFSMDAAPWKRVNIDRAKWKVGR